MRYIPQNFSVEQAKVVHLYSSCCIMASLLVSLLQNKSLFQAICPGCLWARDNRWLLCRVQRLAGPAGAHRPFVPVGGTNRDKRGDFCPGWCLQPGQNSLVPISPSLSPGPSHSAHLFLLFLARERGVLAHFFITFVKIFDSPIHPSVLKVWGLLFSSFLACIAHFML